MSEHLDKAKLALADAKEVDENSLHRAKLLDIAQVQAMVAQAEALERIAVILDARLPSYHARGPG